VTRLLLSAVALGLFIVACDATSTTSAPPAQVTPVTTPAGPRITGPYTSDNRGTDLPFVAQPGQEGTKTTLVQIAGDRFISVYRLVDQHDDVITTRYIVLAPGMNTGVHHIAISP
jgi:hypothetical protein